MNDSLYFLSGIAVGFAFFISHLLLSRKRAWIHGYEKGYKHAREDFTRAPEVYLDDDNDKKK